MRNAYVFLRIAISMLAGTMVAWHESRRLVRQRRLLREQREARIREAHTVYRRSDPRSAQFVFWAREAFAEAYGAPISPERLDARNRAILGMARELLEDLASPEDARRHLRQLQEQLGHITTPAP